MNSNQVASSAESEEYHFDDKVTGFFILATAFWGLVAVVLTAATYLLLVRPDISQGAPEYAYGRIRPIFLNMATFAFAANGLFAAVYYSTQRLCKRRMWSSTLSYAHFWGWQFIGVWSLATMPLGHSQRRELAELVWPIDVAISAFWCLYTLNLLMTVFTRRTRHMYISLWFYLASALTVLPVFLLNNLVNPGQGYESTSLYRGVTDGFVQSWGSQNLQMYMLLIPFMGAMYYFVPKATGRPVANYRLVIVQFWMMTLLGVLAGSRLLHHTAIPEWVASVGMLAGLLMFMPSWVGVTNGLAMLRPAEGASEPLKPGMVPVQRFFLAAVLFYAFVSIESAWTSIKSIGAVTIFTEWSDARAYAITLGWAGMLAFGCAYWIMPKVSCKQLWNHELANIHFWVAGVSTALFVVAAYVAGYLQGSMARAMDSTGTLVYPEYLQIVQRVKPLWWVGFLAACGQVVGIAMLAVNLVMTWFGGQRPKLEKAQVMAPRLGQDFAEEPQPPSALQGAAILELGLKLDVWTRLAWHRAWERSAATFTWAIVAVVALGIVVEFVPVSLFANRLPDGVQAIPYTPLELAGREIFVQEGCVSCHTQTVRPLVAETKRYGDYSRPADFQYDQPALWGTRRIGPDLAREGGKQNGYWHWQHLENPRTLNPESVMPSFKHLLSQDLDIASIRQLLRDSASRGVPYDEKLLAEDDLTVEDRLEGEVTLLEEVIQRQAEVVAADIVRAGGPAAKFDKQATALIAYLQRLGAPPEPRPAS